MEANQKIPPAHFCEHCPTHPELHAYETIYQADGTRVNRHVCPQCRAIASFSHDALRPLEVMVHRLWLAELAATVEFDVPLQCWYASRSLAPRDPRAPKEYLQADGTWITIVRGDTRSRVPTFPTLEAALLAVHRYRAVLYPYKEEVGMLEFEALVKAGDTVYWRTGRTPDEVWSCTVIENHVGRGHFLVAAPDGECELYIEQLEGARLIDGRLVKMRRN